MLTFFYAIVLNEARVIFTSVEKSVYCEGATAWNSLPPTENNLPCHKAFKHHQKGNVKEKTFLSLKDRQHLSVRGLRYLFSSYCMYINILYMK